MIDIFTQGRSISVSWFYFKNIGDNIQGTYIGQITGQKDQFGGDQTVVMLQTDTGIKKIGFKPYSRVLKSLSVVKPGQIVGFKFTGRTKGKTKMGTEVMYKDIAVYADPKMVDRDWIDNNPNGFVANNLPETEEVDIDVDEGDEVGGNSGFGDFDSPVPNEHPVDQVVSVPVEELLRQIAEIAKNKLGAIDASQVKEKVMAATNLAFLPVNYQKILDILKTL